MIEMNLPKRAFLSFRARVIRPLTLKHYRSTKCGRRIASYRNRFAGRRCFFIGNGPSLKADDLTRLRERGEICFAFNRIYNIFDSTTWRPDFYISQDEKMLAGCAETVSRTELGEKFIPINLKWYFDIDVDNACWFMMKTPREEDGKPLEFSDDPAQIVYNAATGMYTAAQLAAYMGFTEIYLIGVDHHFRVSQNNKGEIVVDKDAKDYFTEKYNEDRDKLFIPNTERSTLTYAAMKEQCEKRGIKLFNATRGGKLEVLERVDLDRLLNG